MNKKYQNYKHKLNNYINKWIILKVDKIIMKK